MLNTSSQVKKPRKTGLKIYVLGTPWSIHRRMLDCLYDDLSAKIITAKLLVEISRDMRKALYE